MWTMGRGFHMRTSFVNFWGRTNAPKLETYFYHTSAQAICRRIKAIFGVSWAQNVDKFSGLFQQRCNHCRKDLQLYPIHTRVIVTFYLANSGKEGEKLFGSLDVLACHLGHNADPALQASVSVSLLFGQDEPEDCNHTPLNAAVLATKIPEDTIMP